MHAYIITKIDKHEKQDQSIVTQNLPTFHVHLNELQLYPGLRKCVWLQIYKLQYKWQVALYSVNISSSCTVVYIVEDKEPYEVSIYLGEQRNIPVCQLPIHR